MDSTKNFFDAWMNTQSKLVNNLMDTSQKLQESLGKNEVVEKSVELYHQWFDKQKSLAESMISTIKGVTHSTPKAPDFLKEWMESQLQLGKRWLEVLNLNSQSKQKNPEWLSQFENMQEMYQDWINTYSQIYSQIQQPIPSLSSHFLSTNSLTELFNNSRTYMKMFEMWQPIYKMIQSNTLGVDSLSKILDMDKYKEILDGVFQFMTPEKSQNFLDQIQKYSQVWSNAFDVKSLLSNSIGQLQSLVPNGGFLNGNLNTLAQINQQFSEQFHKFINPYFTMVPASREKEISNLILRVQDKFSKYYIKASEMQNIIYAHGQDAIEKTVKKLMQQSAIKGDLVSFDEFYATWVDTMEQDTIALFGSDNFSKLQGDLLKIGLEIKAGLDKQMEMMLAPFPVVPRSELDEVNATIHELKSKVRDLEHKLEHLAEQQKLQSDVLSHHTSKNEEIPANSTTVIEEQQPVKKTRNTKSKKETPTE